MRTTENCNIRQIVKSRSVRNVIVAGNGVDVERGFYTLGKISVHTGVDDILKYLRPYVSVVTKKTGTQIFIVHEVDFIDPLLGYILT